MNLTKRYIPVWKPKALNNWIEFEDCFFVLADDGSKWFCRCFIDNIEIQTNREFPEFKFEIQQGIVTEKYYSNTTKKYKLVFDDFFSRIEEV